MLSVEEGGVRWLPKAVGGGARHDGCQVRRRPASPDGRAAEDRRRGDVPRPDRPEWKPLLDSRRIVGTVWCWRICFR